MKGLFGGHTGLGDGETFTTLRLLTTFFGEGFLATFFLATGFFVTLGFALTLVFEVVFGVALAVALAVGLGVGFVVAANTVLDEAIIAPATIIASTRPFIRDSI